MQEAHNITVTVRGKAYVITTTEQEQHVVKAAALLDANMHDLEQTSGLKRDDQLALFSALQALVEVIKQVDACNQAVDAHVARVEKALTQE